MMPLYFFILLGSLLIPLLFSVFKIDFIKNWKNFIISTTFIAILFLIWDAIFTHSEFWGFNDDYCLGIYFLKMPIEEWMFFYIIPFCSLFTHFAFFYTFPKVRVPKNITILLSLGLLILSVLLIYFNFQKSYTVVNFSFLFIILTIGLFTQLESLQQFYISFLIILIPFLIVNGILTGALTEFPIVWYDHNENLGIRINTIPIEDAGYAFSMLFGNLIKFNTLNKSK